MRHRIARMLVIAAVAAALTVAGAGPALAVSPDYSVNGVEVAATSTEGTFTGVASGSGGDAAAWYAVVRHEPLSRSGPAEITGGSLQLVNAGASGLESVTGAFTSGSVTFASGGSGCASESYDVGGELATSQGPATFGVRLTHHRTSILGRCMTYAATVVGALAFARS